MHNHDIILMHASLSCIIVTEPSEKEPIEPVEVVEPKPGVEFVLEPERKPRQAAKHDPLHLFKLIQFSYFIWVLLGYVMYIVCYLLHSCTYFYALPFLDLFICILVAQYYDYLTNLTRCLAMLRVDLHLVMNSCIRNILHPHGYP